MGTFWLVLASTVVAATIAFVVQRRRPDAPTNPTVYEAPAQLDRSDFPHRKRPWLVVVFSSATCESCAAVWSRALVLESESVAVVEVEAVQDRWLHQRYSIEAVPITVIADADGVVQAAFVGPVSATHLWGALAELRRPGSVPPGCDAGQAGGETGGGSAPGT